MRFHLGFNWWIQATDCGSKMPWLGQNHKLSWRLRGLLPIWHYHAKWHVDVAWSSQLILRCMKAGGAVWIRSEEGIFIWRPAESSIRIRHRGLQGGLANGKICYIWKGQIKYQWDKLDQAVNIPKSWRKSSFSFSSF